MPVNSLVSRARETAIANSDHCVELARGYLRMRQHHVFLFQPIFCTGTGGVETRTQGK